MENSITSQSLRLEGVPKDLKKKVMAIALLMAVIFTIVFWVFFKPDSITLPSVVFLSVFLSFYFIAPANIEMYWALNEKSGLRHTTAAFSLLRSKKAKKRILNRLSERIVILEARILESTEDSRKIDQWGQLIELYKLNSKFFLFDLSYFKKEFDQAHLDGFLISACARATKKLLPTGSDISSYKVDEILDHIQENFIKEVSYFKRIRDLIAVIYSEEGRKMGRAEPMSPIVPATKVAKAYAEAKRSR